MGRTKNLFCIGLTLILQVLFVSFASASAIVPASSDSQAVSFMPGSEEDGSTDKLTIRPPNEYGISINRFDVFYVNSPLKLINLSKSIDGQDTKSAKLIVIYAPNITINDELEALGPVTDILFITDEQGSITCDSCYLDNFYRIGLVAGMESELPFDSDSLAIETVDYIGPLAAYPVGFDAQSETSPDHYRGSINIGSLYAPGALWLDIVTPIANLENQINLNTRLKQNFDGSYEEDLNGDLVSGLGQVNIVAGLYTWDYEQRKILESQTGYFGKTSSYDSETQTYTTIEPRHVGVPTNINGNIASRNVSIATNVNDSLVSANIDTTSHIATSVSYRNQLVVLDEGININATGDVFRNHLEVSGDLTSNAAININAFRNLHISGGVIQAPVFNVVTAVSVINEAKIFSNIAKIGAKYVENRGLIDASEEAEIWAMNNIENIYGGKIISPRLFLNSTTGTVLNGSTTPYKRAIEFEFYKAPLICVYSCSGRYITPTFLGGGVLFGHYYPDDGYIPDHLFEHQNWEGLDIGFTDSVTSQANEKEIAENTSAYIVGDYVTIKANHVANVNAYWEHPETIVGFEFIKEKIDQVGILANSYLGIQAARVTNESAELSLNSDTGKMYIDAGILRNKRYSFTAILTEPDEGNIGTRMLNVSPPGFISSLGEFKLTGGFLNDFSYFDVKQNAEFNPNGAVTHNAIQLSNFVQTNETEAFVSYQSCKDGWTRVVCMVDRTRTTRNNNASPFGVGGATLKPSYLCEEPGVVEMACSSEGNVSVTESEALSSLFNVSGNYDGPGKAWVVKENVPLRDFQELAAKRFLAEYMPSDNPYALDIPWLQLGPNVEVHDYSLDYDNNNLSVTWEVSTNQSDGSTKTTYETQSYSLFGELVEIYEIIKQNLAELLEIVEW